jgi:eukaryotic-like serine/threonine-protein kinase
MFRGNPAHTGVYATEGPRQLKGVKWVFKTGGYVISSPAVADGIVYIGSDDKNLYAIDAATGAEKWRFATGQPIRSSPAVVDSTVYFGSYDGYFYALESATGKLKWKFAIEGERRFEAKGLHGLKPATQTLPDFWDFFLSSPVVGQGLVYFGCGDGHCYALDAATGQLKWKFATQDVVHSSPALADGLVYFGSWDSYFYALDATTGAERWKFKTGEDKKRFNQVGIQSSPAVVDGVVYFGCRDSHLYALDAKTGAKKWDFPNKATWINTSPAIHGGVAYVGTPIPANFYAIDAASGKLLTKLEVNMPIFSSPAIAGGMAYFGSFNGKLYAVDLKTGAFAWEFQTEASKQHHSEIIGPDGKRRADAFAKSNFFEDVQLHSAAWFALGAFISSPTVDRGVIYLGSTDGNVYAIE